MNNVGTAYVLWLGCLLQLHGLQRLYNGKIFTGLLWMFTFGLFGIGQLVDLLLIPTMVEEHNTKLQSRQGLLPGGGSIAQAGIHRVLVDGTAPLATATIESSLEANPLAIALVRAAANRNGRLSVTQGVLETGAGFREVETALKAMVRTGYVHTSNDPISGVVFYEFHELTT